MVDFVQRYRSLHFNLAMVEATLYRDSANTLIVQPRVLARTEIVQRFVVEGGLLNDIGPVDVEDRQEILSDQDEENLRLWTISKARPLPHGLSTVDEPVRIGANLYVKVNNTAVV